MKKLGLILILSLLSLCLSAQTYSRRQYRVGNPSSWVSSNSFDTKVFNVLDYGADPTGVVAAQTYIQNAIDAAHAYSSATGMGGTVIVPAGNYKISGKMTLRSYMTVNVANNAYFLKFGTSAPFFVFEPTLNDCTLEGGYYDCNGVGSFMADTITNGNYVQLNHFKDLYILSSEQTLNFRMEGDGWMNANTFSDIVVNQFTSFLDETIVTIETGAFDGNRFTNITLQVVPSVTMSVIKKLDGDANTFDNIMVWDWDYVTTESHFCINFTGDSSYNIFDTSLLRFGTGELTDNGINNHIITADNISLVSLITKTIGHPGDTNVDFTWISQANTTQQNLDLGGIVPAGARVIAVEIRCTEEANVSDMSMGAGNVSGGAQFITLSTSIDQVDESLGISDGTLLPAIKLDFVNHMHIWISGAPSFTNWSAMNQGKWIVYITCLKYSI
jgi:hypothetical protein